MSFENGAVSLYFGGVAERVQKAAGEMCIRDRFLAAYGIGPTMLIAAGLVILGLSLIHI